MQNEITFTINTSDTFATVKEYKTPRASYQLLSGDGALRSVVIDPETKDILCVAPPKSLTEEEFIKVGNLRSRGNLRFPPATPFPHQELTEQGTYASTEGADAGVAVPPATPFLEEQCEGAGGSYAGGVYDREAVKQGGRPSPCNEIIEGTMVNLFYDKRIGQWEIATKGAIGGNYWYFRTSYGNMTSQITFRDMFLDALMVPRDTEFNDVPLIASLDEAMVYSFVMQHPMNHIVLPIEYPRLFLVAGYRVLADKTTVRSYPLWSLRERYFADTPLVSFPVEYQVQSYDDMPSAVGVMFHDVGTGHRLSKKNSEYERKRDIRGNHPNLQYHYLELNAENNVALFLHEFPEYTQMFSWFYYQTQNYIGNLQSAYIAYFIQKRGKEIQIPKDLFIQIHNIHKNIYRGTNKRVNRKEIEEYVAGMTVSEQLFHINSGVNLRFAPEAHLTASVAGFMERSSKT